MGMSASQARFLAITARKSNVEFQGQQVNQQRTSLANESAGLFNQMLELEVPVPPSATDFYSMAYTFTENKGDEEKDLPISYRITNWAAAGKNNVEATYRVTAMKVIDDIGYSDKALDVGVKISKTDDGYQIAYPNEEPIILSKATTDLYGKPETDTDSFKPSYSYSRGGRNYYFETKDLEALFTDGKTEYEVTEENQSQIKPSFYKDDKTYETVSFLANMISDDKGRFTGMEYWPNGENGSKQTCNLTIKEVQDERGFNQAMEEYNYKKMMYDRTIEDINSRTEIIQKQDLNLELQLKQLDTEQEALSKEYDAVQQVINKNVETTFKTFG